MEFVSRRLGLAALLALVPPFLLGALIFTAPKAPLTVALFPALLVASGPALPLAVVLGLMGIASEDRKRAALALGLLIPAIACIMSAASRAHVEGENRHDAETAARAAASASPSARKN